MKRINKIVLSAVLFAGVASLGSCESFLDIDKYIYEKITLDSVWMTRERTLQYINGTAQYLPDESKNYSRAWNDSETSDGRGRNVIFPYIVADEAIMPWYPDGGFQGNFVLTGEVTPRDTRGFNCWPDMYKGIRKANIILANLSKNKELTDMERRDLLGRTHFMRGYFYFTLVRLFGPVPILPETAFDTDTPNDEASFPRSSWDDCVEYICAEMEKAVEYLPATREQAFQYMPTSGAAMSVIARLRLYSASPLYNGNPYYAGFNLMPQEIDNSKWGQAAAAFKRVINTNMYQLNTVPVIVNSAPGEGEEIIENGTLELPSTVSSADFPLGAGNIDPYKSYKTIFDGSIIPEANPELIYFYPRVTNSPGDDWLFYPTRQGGITGFSVTKDMADAYKMSDGRPFSEATAQEKSWEAVGTGKTFSLDYVLSPQRAHMDNNREPRYYASISFNYCVWPAKSYDGNDPSRMNLAVEYFWDGNDKPESVYGADRNRTGYNNRKWVNAEDTKNGGRVLPKTYPAFRYAEILLGYVEAMNEMDEDYTDEATGISVSKNVEDMVFYFNQIRYRSGMPGITAADAANQAKMRQLIKDERRIEFAFEGHRWHDLRRWKDAVEAINKPVTGMDINATLNQREQFYTVRVWNTERYMRRVFENRMYLFPIDQTVMDRNGKLVQNPGW